MPSTIPISLLRSPPNQSPSHPRSQPRVLRSVEEAGRAPPCSWCRTRRRWSRRKRSLQGPSTRRHRRAGAAGPRRSTPPSSRSCRPSTPRMRREEGGPARHAPPLHLEVPTWSTSCAGPPATSRASRRPRAAPRHRLRTCSAAGSTASSQIRARHRPRRPPRPPPQKLIVAALVRHERSSRRRACSKVVTSRGLHDRRVRLSVPTAIQFYDIQQGHRVAHPRSRRRHRRAPVAGLLLRPALQQSLTEHYSEETRAKLDEAESTRKEIEEQERLDQEAADYQREKGNEFFKKKKYQEAAAHYTEAMKSNPNDPRVFSNRAQCHIYLGAFPEGLEDADKCIELNPTFLKGYMRKANIQFQMNNYESALATYLEGLKCDPNNLVVIDGLRRCAAFIRRSNGVDGGPEDMKDILVGR